MTSAPPQMRSPAFIARNRPAKSSLNPSNPPSSVSNAGNSPPASPPHWMSSLTPASQTHKLAFPNFLSYVRPKLPLQIAATVNTAMPRGPGEAFSMQSINPIDRDALRDQFRNAQPFPFFYIDNFLKEDFDVEE